MKLKQEFKLHTSLTRGLDDNAKETLEESFVSSTRFLRALKEKLEHSHNVRVKEAELLSHYEDKSWALFQADNIGYRRALRDILNLFVDNKQGNTNDK